MYYEDVFAALNKAGVRYLVVGGVAVVIYGVLRLTADLDLMVDLETENLKKFLKALGALGYKPKLPVSALDFANPQKRASWIANKNMKVFSFFHPQMEYQVIDVFVDEPIPFAAAFRRKKTAKAADTEVNVIGLKDLVALKKISARPQDMNDIKMLEKLARQYK